MLGSSMSLVRSSMRSLRRRTHWRSAKTSRAESKPDTAPRVPRTALGCGGQGSSGKAKRLAVCACKRALSLARQRLPREFVCGINERCSNGAHPGQGEMAADAAYQAHTRTPVGGKAKGSGRPRTTSHKPCKNKVCPRECNPQGLEPNGYG